jgi:hypothetical protein
VSAFIRSANRWPRRWQAPQSPFSARRIPLTHLPPDIGAIKMWLTNRQPKKWSYKQAQLHELGDQMMAYIAKGGPDQ